MIHLLKIEYIKHHDVQGNVIWEDYDVDNLFHLGGHQYLLSVAFATSSGVSVPSNYYLGLDNRTTPALGDTMASLSAEPTQNGYLRQAVSSSSGFTVSSASGSYRALSSEVTFSASGGTWGPVRNLFLATSATSSGYLLCTAPLSSSRTLLDGQGVTMRISVGLNNCS